MGTGSFTPRVYSSAYWCGARFPEGVTTGKCIYARVCGAQLTPELGASPVSVVVVVGAVGWSGIPTKTPISKTPYAPEEKQTPEPPEPQEMLRFS